MVKKIFFILCALALIIAPISAMETPITVHTVPGYKAMIRILNPDYDYSSVIESFHYTANTKGDIIFTYDTSRDTFDMDVWLTYDGEKMGNKRFDQTFDAGFPIDVSFYPSWYVPPTKETPNTTITNETTLNATTTTNSTEALVNETESISENQTQPEKKRVTAFSVQDGKISISAKAFYYFLGLIVLAALVFVGLKNAKHLPKRDKSQKPQKKEIKVTKMSDLKKNQGSGKTEKMKEQEDKIEQAKRMIEEAQQEIQKMKNPNQAKIDEIKKRLVEDEKELMRLRKESGDID